MQFAVWPSNDRSWDETLAQARFAESHGFASFWAADHLLTYGADDERPDGDVMECWTVLAAIGAAVPRLRLVSVVSPVTIHHPVVLAKRAITADHVSGGRAVLGLGAGWQVNEHLAYGFELPPPAERVDRFEEAIEVVHRLVRGEQVSFAGRHFQIDGVTCKPAPVGPLPILVGTSGARMARVTARWADEWNVWGAGDRLASRTATFLQACESVGRDPATVRRSAQAMVYLVDTPEQRAAAAAAATPGATLIGNASELIEQFDQYVALGVQEFGILDDPLGSSPAERMEMLERLHAEVLVHVS